MHEQTNREFLVAEGRQYEVNTGSEKSNFTKFFGRMERVNKDLIEINEALETKANVIMVEHEERPQTDIKSPKEILPLLWNELHNRLSQTEDLLGQLRDKIDRIQL